VGDCFDNAMCESFFDTLECELLDHSRFETQAEAKIAVFDFIEGWYNSHRRHSFAATVTACAMQQRERRTSPLVQGSSKPRARRSRPKE
ncbi:MAG: IS3 family transposase, partial [Gammaproteobacteria bacterium]